MQERIRVEKQKVKLLLELLPIVFIIYFEKYFHYITNILKNVYQELSLIKVKHKNVCLLINFVVYYAV
jgi:hypothetical protein